VLYADTYISARRAKLHGRATMNGEHSHISRRAAEVGLLAFAIDDTRQVLEGIREFMSAVGG